MIDLLDTKLIALLEKNAAQTSNKLAEQLPISSATVRRRMKELIKNGVIRVVAIPEPKQIGLPLITVIAFELEHAQLNSFCKTLRKMDRVKSLYVTSGRFDAIAIMWFSSTEELFNFMEKDIAGIEGIKGTETFLCLHVEKSF
ncbi:MAG: Lrp/AsnC family transcriptional regulator [Dehalococcoidales bacterium]|nr:Lrp/AsnC family transcriptional regulator [Dehalococcoidales bacterium]